MRNVAVDKIDAGYLYELSWSVRPLKGLGQGNLVYPWQAWGVCTIARDTIVTFIEYSIYSSGLRTCRLYGQKLVHHLNLLIDRMENNEWPNQQDIFKPTDTLDVVKSFNSFEPVMIAELQSLPIFFVPPRGAFDNAYLIEAGDSLFPSSLYRKVPDTKLDAEQVGKCIAFNLPTAAGFHLHRVNEAVLRKYYDFILPFVVRKKTASMGVLLASLKKEEKGSPAIIASLDAIKDFHRNPLMHPDHTLGDTEEAISLYCAIRAAIGYMLDVIPETMDHGQAKGLLTNSILSAAAFGK